MRARALPAFGRAVGPSIATALVALVVAWLAQVSGNVHDSVATLIVIGFSPDRSVLITALVIEGVAVAVGTFVAARRPAAICAGLAVAALLYYPTFVAETVAAVHSSGVAGTFDPMGWVLTLTTLVVSALVVAWSVATLIGIARAQVIRAVDDLRSIRSRGLGRRTLGRPAVVAVIAIFLIGTMPVLGDMLNYEPDMNMRTGGAAALGLTGSDPGMSFPAGLPSIAPSLLAGGGIIGPSTQPGVRPPASVLATTKPWLQWIPTGSGRLVQMTIPGPFGPPGATTIVETYLPPGYDTSTRRYPVLYEMPWGAYSWQKGVNLLPLLDGLIDSGTIPPVIVVFVRETGGAYADTECANSFDGKIWYANWVVQTVVPTIDTTYRTIATAAARATMGFSQGGFCSSMFVVKDPTVFGTAISFSGYFQAGIRSSQTVNAWIPYGGNAAYEALYSPIDLAPAVPAADRPFLMVELSANPVAPFYGPQYAGFTSVLKAAGIPVALFPTPLGPSWEAVRLQMPEMLGTWAERMTALSVFG